MSPLPTWQSIPLFIIIIGILVLVHELGHYLAARRFGVEAPEFGLGFPPRLLTFWKTGGWIQIHGRKIYIPRTFKLPAEIQFGTWVTYQTEHKQGCEILTAIAAVSSAGRGPRIAQVQALDRGTEFTLNAIPFGGFVRMNEDLNSTAPNAFVSKPAWQRGIILIAGVAMNFLLAFIVFIALAAWVPQMTFAATTTIHGVLPNTPAAKAGLRVGDTIVSVNGVEVKNNRSRMIAELTANCEKPVILGVERPTSKSVERLELEIVPRPTGDLPCAMGVQIAQDVGAKIASVRPGSIAAQAGLRPGDALVQMGDYSVLPAHSFTGLLRDENDLRAYVLEHYKVRTIVIVRFIRDGVPQQVKVTIPEDLRPEEADLGLSFHLGLPQAIAEASGQMYAALMSVPRALRELVSNLARGENTGVVGPVGINQIIAEGTPSGGLPFLVSVIGVLSLNLAIFNLLPIPGLDGGRLLFVIAEILTRGRKLDPAKEGLIHLAGFMFLIVFILVISYFDVTRVLSGRPLFGP